MAGRRPSGRFHKLTHVFRSRKGKALAGLGGAVSRHGVSGPPAAEVRVADNTTKWISGAHGVYRELSCLCEVMKTDGLKFVFNDGAVLTWRHDMT